jgi:hypothetical protein
LNKNLELSAYTWKGSMFLEIDEESHISWHQDVWFAKLNNFLKTGQG